MNINKFLRSQTFLLILFSIVFVFDFVRLTLFAYNVEPPLVDGLFYILFYTMMSLAIGILFVDCFNSRSAFYAVLVTFLLLVAVAPALAGTVLRPQHADLITFYLNIAFLNASFAAMGYIYARYGINFSQIFLLWAVMVAVTVPAIIQMMSAGFGMETRLALAGMHITLGDQLMMVTLILIAAARTIERRFLFFFIGVVCLSAVGSRTSLYAFAIALPLIMLEKMKWRDLISLRIVPVLLVTATLPYIVNYITGDSARGTRMFGFFSEGARDSSWLGRVDQMNQGLSDIANNPIMGSFGSDIDRYGEWGRYIHNYLELWRQLGILPFTIFVSLVIYTIIATITRKKSISDDARFAVIILLVPITVQLLFSRSYGYPQIFFILGMMAFLTAGRLSKGLRIGVPASSRAHV